MKPNLYSGAWRLAIPLAWIRCIGGSEVFVERVKELTNGRFEIILSAAGEIVPGLEVLDAV